VTVYTNRRIRPVKPETIPAELKARPQWVVWKAVGDKPDKVPYSVSNGRRASSTDLMTWGTFEEALEAYESGERGWASCSRAVTPKRASIWTTT
jgi:primase-polymerase (primpol)-like protein